MTDPSTNTPSPDDQAPYTPPPPPSTGDEFTSGIWMRGLITVILFLLFEFAQTLVIITALMQFLWMLISGERNPRIAHFGERLANWLAVTARFQSGASELRPFPWTPW